MKPNWIDAPEWANWMAMDSDCEWYWFENKPEIEGDGWDQDKSMNQNRHELAMAGCWTQSVERRPESASSHDRIVEALRDIVQPESFDRQADAIAKAEALLAELNPVA